MQFYHGQLDHLFYDEQSEDRAIHHRQTHNGNAIGCCDIIAHIDELWNGIGTMTVLQWITAGITITSGAQYVMRGMKLVG
jgi:hypothetical protein